MKYYMVEGIILDAGKMEKQQCAVCETLASRPSSDWKGYHSIPYYLLADLLNGS